MTRFVAVLSALLTGLAGAQQRNAPRELPPQWVGLITWSGSLGGTGTWRVNMRVTLVSDSANPKKFVTAKGTGSWEGAGGSTYEVGKGCTVTHEGRGNGTLALGGQKGGPTLVFGESPEGRLSPELYSLGLETGQSNGTWKFRESGSCGQGQVESEESTPPFLVGGVQVGGVLRDEVDHLEADTTDLYGSKVTWDFAPCTDDYIAKLREEKRKLDEGQDERDRQRMEILGGEKFNHAASHIGESLNDLTYDTSKLIGNTLTGAGLASRGLGAVMRAWNALSNIYDALAGKWDKLTIESLLNKLHEGLGEAVTDASDATTSATDVAENIGSLSEAATLLTGLAEADDNAVLWRRQVKHLLYDVCRAGKESPPPPPPHVQKPPKPQPQPPPIPAPVELPPPEEQPPPEQQPPEPPPPPPQPPTGGPGGLPFGAPPMSCGCAKHRDMIGLKGKSGSAKDAAVGLRALGDCVDAFHNGLVGLVSSLDEARRVLRQVRDANTLSEPQRSARFAEVRSSVKTSATGFNDFIGLASGFQAGLAGCPERIAEDLGVLRGGKP